MGDHHHGPAKGLGRWLFTTNHKDIGTMYLWFSFAMFILGGFFAMIIRAELFQRTQGHPLFTVELLHDMQERGVLMQNEAGAWVESPELDWEALPARVEGAIGECLHLGVALQRGGHRGARRGLLMGGGLEALGLSESQ